MNKLLKILIAILFFEILIGYYYYQKLYLSFTGNFISSILLVTEEKFLYRLSSKDKKEKIKITREKKLLSECKNFNYSNLEFSVTGIRAYRSPLYMQSSLNFMNFDQIEKKYLIAIVGNSEAKGASHSKKIHTILEENLNKHFGTENIFVINLSNDGYTIKDQIIVVENFLNIYPIDMVIFYSGEMNFLEKILVDK